MEPNVWTQLFAQVATFLSKLFASLSNQRSRSNGGSSPVVLANVAASISTSNSVEILAIVRNPALVTTDALFGTMTYQNKWIGVTMERTAVCIPEGTYRGYKRDSAHFGMRVVGIDVPNRTDIECHPANTPQQVKGCVAVGSTKDGDAIDSSMEAFDRMMAAVPETFLVKVTSL